MWVLIYVSVVSGPTTTASFVRVAVVTSSWLTLALSRAVIAPYVDAMFYPTPPPPWRFFQKDTPPVGQARSCQVWTNRSQRINMNRDLQTCSMSADPKKYIRQTSLPAHKY